MLGNRQGGRERGRGRGSLCVTQVSLFLFQMKKEQKGIKRGGKQGVQQLFPGIAGSGEVGKVEPKKADRALHQYTFPLLSVPWPFHSFGRASCTCSSLFLHVVTLLSCFSRVELKISGHKRRLTAGFELLTCFSLSGSHFSFSWHSSPTFRVIPPPHSSRNQFVFYSTSASGWGKGRSRSCLGFGQGWKMLLLCSLFFLSSLLWCASSLPTAATQARNKPF